MSKFERRCRKRHYENQRGLTVSGTLELNIMVGGGMLRPLSHIHVRITGHSSIYHQHGSKLATDPCC